jgi:phage baseplate assembly protein V
MREIVEMVAKMRQSLAQTSRRVLTTVGRGRVTASDDTGGVQLLQVKLGDNELRDNTPRLSEFGFASRPPAKADVVVLFVGGDRSNGVVIATGDLATRFKNLKPGESALYDAFGKSIYLSESGITVQCNGETLTIDGETVVKGSLGCTGNLLAGTGASGAFTTAEGLTVTVQDGIITNIA